MRKSTIKLTKHELDVASDTIYPQTKQSVMLKLQQLFTACGQKLNQNLAYQELTASRQFKITKGEQYKGMPYMVLDTPQIKGPQVNFVLRTMFWWGHYITCNLIIRTDNLSAHQEYKGIRKLRKTYLLNGSDLWEQDLDSPAFTKCSALSEDEIKSVVQSHTYLKLSRKIALRKYAELPKLVDAIYTEWLTSLSIKKGAD
ncbi:MAG: hypothetical protein V4590_07710 [Bacteroidota bacterium]